MNILKGIILAVCILSLGTEFASASVDADKDIQLVKAANTQFSSNATLEQVFAAYPLFKKVEWRSTPTPDGRNSTVQVIGTYDLDKFVGLQYGEALPQALVEDATVNNFKAEYSSVQYIIIFGIVHIGSGTAVKVDSTSFNLIINGSSNFFPDTQLHGFRDIIRKKPPQFILSGLGEMRPIRNNTEAPINQVSIE